jgi:hypothetical protein
MVFRFLVLTIAMAFVALGNCQALAQEDISVLFVGNPEGPRMADFTSFLEKYFSKVGALAAKDFTPDAANGFDVVIFDYKLKDPKMPDLPLNYDKASVLISSGGALFNRELKLKIDWL